MEKNDENIKNYSSKYNSRTEAIKVAVTAPRMPLVQIDG